MGYHYLMRSGNVYVKHWLAIAISVATVCVYFLQNTLQSELFNIDLRSTGVKTWGREGGNKHRSGKPSCKIPKHIIPVLFVFHQEMYNTGYCLR